MVSETCKRSLSCALGAAACLWLVTASAADETGSARRTVADIEVHLGVVPAALVRGHPRGHPEREMHGGAPAGGYHVMVALFDVKTGARITDARVSARLAPYAGTGAETRLEPMTVAGALTYGNYLDMVAGGSYRIVVTIRRPGVAEPVEASFQWVAR